MTKNKKTREVKASRSLPPKVLVKEEGVNVWLTKRQFNNRLKDGKKVTVTERSKAKANEYKKEFILNNPKELTGSEVEIFGKSRNRNYQKSVEDIEINQDAIDDIKRRIKRKNGTFYTKEYYKTLLTEARISEETENKNLDEFLTDFANKNSDVLVVVHKETKGGNFHYQTGAFVDRLGKVEDEFTKGTRFYITDFKGEKNQFDSVSKASKLLRSLNSVINEALNEVNPKLKNGKGKRWEIYVRVKESTTSRTGKTISLEQDFSQIDIMASGYKEKQFNAVFDRLKNEWIKNNYNGDKFNFKYE